MKDLDMFTGLDGFLKNMEYFIGKPKPKRHKKFTYWRYDERLKILKDIDREWIVNKLDEDVVLKMEKQAMETGSDNYNGFIVQYS